MSKTILVIDDDVDFLRLMKHVLELQGFEAELKPSPQAGLKYFEENCAEIKLAIIDVLMPGMMGPELVKRLRTLQPEIKVLFASAYAIEIVDEATQRPFPLLHKPLKPKQAIEKIRGILAEDSQPTFMAASGGH
jgi:two-component system, cell cycle sensor histidine kinase and response regulator CckA